MSNKSVKNFLKQILDRFYYHSKTLGHKHQIDIIYFIKNGIATLAGQFGSAILGLIVTFIFANYLSKHILGQYQYILSLIGFLSAFTLPGANTVIATSTSKGHGGILHQSVKDIFRFSLIGSLALIGYSVIKYLNGETEAANTTLYVSFIFPVFSIITSWRAYSMGKTDFVKINQYQIYSQLAIIGAQALVVFLLPSAFLLIVSYTMGTILINLGVTYHSLIHSQQQPCDKPGLIYGKKLSLILSISIIASYLDKIILSHFMGFTNLAIYSIASLIPEQIRQFFGSLSGILYPKFSTSTPSMSTKNRVIKSIIALTLLMTLLVLGYICLSYPVFSILLPQYLDALPYTQIFSLILIATPITILEIYFRTQNNKKNIFYYNNLGNSISIIAYIILIPRFGIWGAIFGRLLNYYISNLYLFVAFIKINPIPTPPHSKY